MHGELPVSQSLKIITPVFTRKKLNKLKSNNSCNERNKVTGQTAPPQHWRDRQTDADNITYRSRSFQKN